MTDTRLLLSRIAALRQRLERTPALHKDDASTGPEVIKQRIRVLDEHVAAGSRNDTLLDSAMRPMTESAETAKTPLPARLTSRARRLLTQGRDLLGELRNLANALPPEVEQHLDDPLANCYRETVHMVDTALRTVQSYPDSPSVQLQLCEGLEGTLRVIDQRLATLKAIINQKAEIEGRVKKLAHLFLQLEKGEALTLDPFGKIVEAILADARESEPIRWLWPDLPTTPDKAWQAEAVASHCLTSAQVAARLVRFDSEFRGQPFEPVLAALVHDAGMVAVPLEVYTHSEKLDDDQMRHVERHPLRSAEMAERILPGAAWLAEVGEAHHERLDGTGYPAGRREMQVSPMARLVAVCDTYAALCCPRPYRPAREPRTALTDTLLIAEQGGLDRAYAERLLQLSFYPVGSVVEMSDGALAVVVAGNMNRRDMNAPARPVIILLTDAKCKPLPVPRPIDLAESEDRSIVRSLAQDERRRQLGKHYPELCI